VNAVLFDATAPEQVYVGTDIGVFRLAPDGSWTALQEGMPNVIVLGLSQNPATACWQRPRMGEGLRAGPGRTGGQRAPHHRVVNAAGLENTLLAPGMVTALFGSNLAEANTAPATLPLPLSLADTSVLVNGVATPLFFVSPSQINFQMPYESAGGW